MTRLRDWLSAPQGHRFWTSILAKMNRVTASELETLRRDADRLGLLLKRFELAAATQLGEASESGLPDGVDWSHRAEIFTLPISPAGHAPLTNQTVLSEDVTVFGDDPNAQVSLRQIAASGDLPFALILDVEKLGGSFLSFAIGLGAEAAKGFGKADLIGVHLDLEMETEVECHVRLNLRSGPNIERVNRPFTHAGPIDFDLFYVEFDPQRMSDAWVDIILPPQRNNRLILRDILITRRPRAEI